MKTQYYKLMHLPKCIRYSLGIVLIVFGIANVVNPFINGIICILAGVRLLSEDIYQQLKKKYKNRK